MSVREEELPVLMAIKSDPKGKKPPMPFRYVGSHTDEMGLYRWV